MHFTLRFVTTVIILSKFSFDFCNANEESENGQSNPMMPAASPDSSVPKINFIYFLEFFGSLFGVILGAIGQLTLALNDVF